MKPVNSTDHHYGDLKQQTSNFSRVQNAYQMTSYYWF